jgi:hydrogenase nickel incorporation protein HypB
MENVMKANDMYAAETKKILAKNNIRMYNLIGSPGAGKTSVLENLLPLLEKNNLKTAVIEGDCTTTRDAERIAAVSVPVVQINTGSACHLDANLIYKALDDLDLSQIDILFVENVGNMICPVGFNIGEDSKVAVISTAEGDDKPLKYPVLFKESDFVILTKTDLVPYTNFDMDFFKNSLSEIKTNYEMYAVSNTSNENFGDLVNKFTN